MTSSRHTASTLGVLLALVGGGCRIEHRQVADTVQVVGHVWVVSADGVGPLRIGMSRSQIGSALGQPVGAGYAQSAHCQYVYPTGLPSGVSLLVTRDTLARVDVDRPGVRTIEGAEVGDSIAQVVSLYQTRSRATETPSPGAQSAAAAQIVVSVPGDSVHRMVFQIVNGRVSQYRVGRTPEVDLDGCQ